jgi:hypothetical protein
VPSRPARGVRERRASDPARRWLGLTATQYRRDEFDDLIALQLGPVRHTMNAPEPGTTRRHSGDGKVPSPGSDDRAWVAASPGVDGARGRVLRRGLCAIAAAISARPLPCSRSCRPSDQLRR